MNDPLRTDWVDILFYASFVFITLGGITTIGLLVSRDSDHAKILVAPMILVLLLGPTVQAVVICIIMRKLYKNILSGVANLLASLVIFVSSAWVMLSALPLKEGSFSLLPLFGMLFVPVGHFLTLVITLGLGQVIKLLKRKFSSVM